ncbi:MAG: hypothetical protein KDA58_01495, partial [Planctomycetaceae bacterium]|nr:hypothetical protein [Planctomycetaceae bacterium]
DDALELEGEAAGIEAHNNLIVDFHESFGLSPVLSGPVRLVKNVAVHPQVKLNGAQIKLVVSERDAAHPIGDIAINNNVLWGNWLCWTSPYTQIGWVVVGGNWISVRQETDPPFPDGVIDCMNIRVPIQSQDESLTLQECLDRVESLATEIERPLPAIPSRVDVGPTWWDWAAHPATSSIPDIRWSGTEADHIHGP